MIVVGSGVRSKVAVTVLLDTTRTVHLAPLTESQPPQERKVEPVAGVAVTVAEAPDTNDW